MTSAKSRPPQSIGINYDSKCNARCGHCCVNSSPEASDSLTDAQVDQIVSEALEIDEIREIGFTGGEPLLRQQRLLDLMKRVTDSGRSVTRDECILGRHTIGRRTCRLTAVGGWPQVNDHQL